MLIGLGLAIASCGLFIPEADTMPGDAQKALKGTTELTAYSLEPVHPPHNKNVLQGYTVLGEVDLSGQEAKDIASEYSDALQEYIDEARLHGNSTPGCLFQPRHALRVSTGGHTYDYLASFSCGLIEVYKDNQRYWSGQVRGTAVKLDEMFQAHHVPVSKTAN